MRAISALSSVHISNMFSPLAVTPNTFVKGTSRERAARYVKR